MRTTIAIDDHLLDAAKAAARQRGLTLGALVEDALRKELARRADPAPGPPVPVFRGGTGPRPGVDMSSTRALLEVVDDGRPLDNVR